MKKQCKTCKIDKEIREFRKSPRMKDGHRGSCKICECNYSKNWNSLHSERRKENWDNWYRDKKELRVKYCTQWREDNIARSRALTAKHRAKRYKAIPIWSSDDDLEKIVKLYEKAHRLTIETGTKHVIDHIIPLRGRIVWGFHVSYNIRVVTQSENQRKANRLLPIHRHSKQTK